jgi:hypothetical protein
VPNDVGGRALLPALSGVDWRDFNVGGDVLELGGASGAPVAVRVTLLLAPPRLRYDHHAASV